MFKQYKFNPVINQAYEVQEKDLIEQLDSENSLLHVMSYEEQKKGHEPVAFMHEPLEPILSGDFIVQSGDRSFVHSRRLDFLKNVQSCAK